MANHSAIHKILIADHGEYVVWNENIIDNTVDFSLKQL
jgi:hypothetical protein